MKVLVLDPGNSIIKAKLLSGGEVVFPHALVPISWAQYSAVCESYNNGEIPDDFMRIGEGFYAIGDSAERFGVTQHERGAARYRRDYIGVFAAAAMARSYRASTELALFVSHPPGHINYAGELMKAVIGRWDVELGGKKISLYAEYVNTFDEPTGGLMNVLLKDNGTQYAAPQLKEKSVLVIDIGGGTTDFVTISAAGQIDYAQAHTEEIGIQEVIDNFTSAFRARYKELTKSKNALAPDRVREAIETGIFRGGGDSLPCQEEAEQARNTLVNRILRVTSTRYAGGFRFDAVLLTGGGSGLLYTYLWDHIQNKNIHLADEPGELHLANVRGGLKLWRLYTAIGVIS